MHHARTTRCTHNTEGDAGEEGFGGNNLLDVLPPGALVEVMRAIGFPSRQRAASVSTAFRDAARDEAFVARVRPGETITSRCATAAPGDTVEVQAGYYVETVRVTKPLKLVGARTRDIFGGTRLGVVIEVTLDPSSLGLRV